jgi:ferric-dicitrate binding protein FerR (iron transport regulator)
MAASVAILVSIGFYFFENSSNNSIREFANKQVGVSNEARIIISDGSEYRLKSNNSHIQYDADGKKIVIEEKIGQAEKLNNQSKDAKDIYNQIVVPYGRRHSVTLSDGTVVKLNSGSKLVFPAKFSDSKREVFLKGEGFFDVAKNAGKPFIVKTDYINVKVLGTHFNISAYENEKAATAVLVEGSVEVYNNNFFNNNRCKIKPGQGCFFTENAAGFKIQNVDVNEYVSWKDGYFQFKDQQLGTIAKKVEKYYNKKISFDDNELALRIISGKLVLAERFEVTMDFLARATKSRYILKENGTCIFVKK